MPVLVIGPQRTGTSLMAGILERLGFDLGLNPISPNREYYESDEWIKLCQEVAGDWRCPQIHFISEQTKQKFAKLIQSNEGKQWAAKTPYFALLGHIICPMIPNLKVIRCERDFETTVQSLCRREQNMQEGVARGIQQQAFAASLLTDRCLANLSIPAARVQYDELIDDPEKIINAIIDFVCEKPVDMDAAVKFVNPLLRHFEEVA